MFAPVIDQLLVDAHKAELRLMAPRLEQRRQYHEQKNVARLEAALNVARQRLSTATTKFSQAR